MGPLCNVPRVQHRYITAGSDRVMVKLEQARRTPNSNFVPLVFEMAQNLDLRCVLISDPSTLGAGAKTRLHTPKAVTYHEQSQIMNHT